MKSHLVAALTALSWALLDDRQAPRPDAPSDIPSLSPPPKPATPAEVDAYRADRLRRKRENWLKRQPKGRH